MINIKDSGERSRAKGHLGNFRRIVDLFISKCITLQKIA